MADDVKPRLRAPKTARKGETVAIKSMILHPMESGRRKGPDGAVIPRKIIHRHVLSFNGEEVFRAEISPMTASPLRFEIDLEITEAGKLSALWIEDGDERRWTAEADIALA